MHKLQPCKILNVFKQLLFITDTVCKLACAGLDAEFLKVGFVLDSLKPKYIEFLNFLQNSCENEVFISESGVGKTWLNHLRICPCILKLCVCLWFQWDFIRSAIFIQKSTHLRQNCCVLGQRQVKYAWFWTVGWPMNSQNRWTARCFCNRVASNLWWVECVICLRLGTVNPLYNGSVGPQWFMTLKWICRCNDFLLFRLRDEKTQSKCAAISTWFAMSESLISNLDKSAETRCRTIFPNQVFR